MHYLKEYQTPIGVLCMVSNSNAVTHLLPRHLQHAFPPDCVQLETAAMQQAAQQLQQYFAGERTVFDFPMQPGGTDFQLRVWQALKRIPYGQTRTYGQIATALGNPKGGRSIGSANNKNPIMIAIPCHRVIGANGALVGYAGGLEQKEYLLTLEQKKGSGGNMNLTAEKGTIQGNILNNPKEGGCYTLTTHIAPESNHVVTHLTNRSENGISVRIGFWCDGEEQPTFTVRFGLFPKIKTQVALDLKYLDGHRLFLDPNGIGLKTVVDGIRVDREKVTKIGLLVDPTNQPVQVEIDGFFLCETVPPMESHPVKIVDDLGQWKQREWPGKTESIDQLSAHLHHALDCAETFAGFDYGSGPKFSGTGFFRLEQVSGRFVLVTPDGDPFFSSGIDGIRTTERGRYEGIEDYFEYLPKDDAEIATNEGSHHSSNRFPCMSFVASNLKRVFGQDWQQLWRKYVAYKIQDWGFNTIAAWSDEILAQQSGIPYVAFLNHFPTTKHTVYRDFPDVFSEEYVENAIAYAKQLAQYKESRQLIGYFMGNEPNFGFANGLNVGEEVLRNPEPLASKQKLIEHLQGKYQSDITALNRAWHTMFSCFDDLAQVDGKTQLSHSALADLDEFSVEMVRQYIKIPAEELKKVDPNHLNLGIRFAWIAFDALYACGEFVDVFSINCYEYDCSPSVDKIFANTNKPVIIGEYHFGALDRGLPATGVRGAYTQQDRTKALQYYLEHAMANPNCVGVHYFQMYDQNVLGRPDGENYQIGLLDVCSREYGEVADGYRQSHGRMMDILFGKQAPQAETIEKIRPVFY